MKQSTKRMVSLVAAILLFACTLVVYLTFTKPAYDGAQQIKSETISRENFVAGQKTAIDQVQKLIANYQGQNQLKDIVSLVLPAFRDESGMLHEINTIAAIDNLTMQSFTVSSPTVQNTSATSSLVKPVGVLTAEFKLLGSYESFKKFMSDIETNIRIFDIKNVIVDPAGRPKDDLYSYDVTIAAYYQNQ